jgi:hypothetical protein
MVIGVLTSGNSAAIVPKQTRIKGSIQHSFASLSIIETYRNESTAEALDCGLHINGGQNFIVYNIKMTINGKDLDFALREIDEATEVFQQATSRRRTAAVGLKNESSDALHLEIGNIPPECDIEVHFECSLCGILTTPKQFRFSVPRATEAGSPSVEIEMDVLQVGDIESVQVNQPGFSFTSKSPTEGQIIVSAGAGEFERSIEVVVNLVNEVETAAVLTTIDGKAYAGIAAVADIPSKEDLKCEFYLVIDCSGSMSGHSIQTARETLIFFLRSLPKDCLFNVIRFGTAFEAMFSSSQRFTEMTQQQAIQNSNVMAADMGGTDLYSPLGYVFGLPTVPGYSRQVFVLTDGQVSGEAEIIALATSHRRNHRIFSVGIGNSIERTFIEDLAVSTGGESAFVSSSGDEALVATMAQLKSALRPAVVECQLHISDTETFEASPFPIPTLFHKVLSHVYVQAAEISDEAGILISGRAGEKQIDIATLVSRVPPAVRFDKFFAYFNIRDLEERISLALEPEIPLLKERVVRLSMQSAIVSQFPALCGAVEDVPDSNTSDTDQSSPAKISPQAIPTHPRQHVQRPMPTRGRGLPQQGFGDGSPRRQFTATQQATQRQTRSHIALEARTQGSQQVQQPVQSWGSGSQGFSQVRPQMRAGAAVPQSFAAIQPQMPAWGPDPQFQIPEASRSRAQQGKQFQASRQPMIAPRPEPASPPARNSNDVPGVISQQAFDGYWSVPLPGFDSVPWDTIGLPTTEADSLKLVQQTLYALAFLEKTAGDKRVLWDLVSDKARDWLNSQAPLADWDALIAQLKTFVP